MVEKPHALQRARNAGLRQLGRVKTVTSKHGKVDGPRGWFLKTARHVEGRRFPRAIWSDQTDNLVFGDLKGDVVESEKTTESHCHSLEGERDRVRGRVSHGVQN